MQDTTTPKTYTVELAAELPSGKILTDTLTGCSAEQVARLRMVRSTTRWGFPVGTTLLMLVAEES